VGKLRFGFFVDGKPVLAHQFIHSNLITGTYMGRASLHVRYEISSTGGAGSLEMICATVISDGGFNPSGRQFSYARSLGESTTIATSYEPLISMRIRASETSGSLRPFRKILVLPTGVNVASTSGANTSVQVIIFRGLTSGEMTTILNPGGGSTDPSWFTANDDSGVELDISADNPAVSSSTGTIIATGYFTNNSDSLVLDFKSTNYFLGTDVDGESDLLTVFVQTMSGQETYYGGLTWREYA
jgi:hypothetical protein